MVDKEKIILMTKLAIYDRTLGEKDQIVNEYFRHDFVYKKNSSARFFAIIGGIILLLFDYTKRIFVESEDIFMLDLNKEIINIFIFLGIIMIFYTIVGSLKYNYEYTLAQRRLKRYDALINKLNRVSESVEIIENKKNEPEDKILEGEQNPNV